MVTASPARLPAAFAARVAYGALFVVLLPVSLVLWSHCAMAVHVPALHAPRAGAVIALIGALCMLAAMLQLWLRGGGLPMNAFPPPRFVSTGLYSLVPHPVYGGFVLLCAGVAVRAGSAAGLWLVTPAIALACSALVLGYELPDLRHRFGPARLSPWFPAAHPGPPTLIERIRVYPVVLLPWLVLFQLTGWLGPPPDAASTYLPFEARLPVWAWAEPVYASTYLAVLLAPWLAPSAQALRLFAQRALISMAFIFPCYLLLPFYVPPRPFQSSGFLGDWLLTERTSISGSAAFPSFHVVWAFIVASALGRPRGLNKAAWWIWAALVALSCILTGMHSIADILAAIAAYILIARSSALWRAVLAFSQQIANSWRELRIGPLRIINHGAYAGAAAFVGMLIIDSLAGAGAEWLSLSICLASIVGAALWAQWVEGSPALLRPLGFYGGMIGAAVGSLAALPLHVSIWCAFAAVCVAAPWIQAIGRLRCLVQGCCHGRPTDSPHGIRYTHPRSRVCRLAHLAGTPVHATPVYSILWNVLTGFALLRLLHLHAPAVFLCGVYGLLSGLGRFVEEAYRGEPQTRIVAGLRFYQWIAIASVVAGAAATCVPNPIPLPVPEFRLASLFLATGCAALTWFVTGVDFPESTRRFARLT